VHRGDRHLPRLRKLRSRPGRNRGRLAVHLTDEAVEVIALGARKGLSTDICPLVALSLARWGHTNRAHLHDRGPSIFVFD
jgi:hypothetical protein